MATGGLASLLAAGAGTVGGGIDLGSIFGGLGSLFGLGGGAERRGRRLIWQALWEAPDSLTREPRARSAGRRRAPPAAGSWRASGTCRG